MSRPDLVIVSNRGPLSFSIGDDGHAVARRGGGGLVSTLGPVVAGARATWVAAAITDADRQASGAGVVEAEGFRLRSLAIEAEAYRQFYDVIANSTLWFMHHHLFDLARRPHIDHRWRTSWSAFVDVNRTFAEAVADEAADGATVVVHDYQLPLVGAGLAELRPDLRTCHFHHTPFADPDALAVLPDDVAATLVAGMAAHGACGFHSARWARSFEASCRAVLGRVPTTFVSPAAVGVDDLRAVATGEECRAEAETLRELVGDRRVIVRVDRIEPSKNVLRGFRAFEELLVVRPEWRERVVFHACIYPSRETLPDYLAYRAEVETLVARINTTWSTPDWTPILLDTSDVFARSLAALGCYDVLLVNPVRDGLNLVALEGSVINRTDGVLVLSREAGVFDQLGEDALAVNPFDIAATAEALHQALTMDGSERSARAGRLRSTAERRRPREWLADQVDHARAPSV